MENLYDVIVVGGGSAGLTAALYLARAKYRVLVLEKDQFGGQISITHEIVNYPGIEITSGKTLTDTMQKQAEAFGAEFVLAEAIAFDFSGDIKTVHTNRGDYRCFGVLLATGAHPRNVGFKGEEEQKGRGVAYCATCDGEFFTGKDIYVAGGGYAAAEESVFLTKFARHVTIDEETKQKIRDIKDNTDMKILVTLSCTMCPDLVVAAQKIAAENPYITAQVYDIRHFDDLRERYNVMSVSWLVINDDKISFGKKNVNQVQQLILN